VITRCSLRLDFIVMICSHLVFTSSGSVDLIVNQLICLLDPSCRAIIAHLVFTSYSLLMVFLS
jgi:hypothetical protein